MNNNFTKNAKDVISNGTDEAMRLKSSFIDTGHLILGMLRIKSCTAYQILHKYIPDLSEFKLQIEKSITNGNNNNGIIQDKNSLPLGTTTARVLQLAFLESISMHLPKVGTRHILAGILRLEKGNIIRDILYSFNLTLDDVRTFNNNIESREINTSIEIYMQGDASESFEKIITMSKPLSSVNNNSNKNNSNTSNKYLNHFCRDLSLSAEKGELDTVVGRDDVIERVSQILSRRKKNNPILVGEAGVGKSAIAEGLALRIAKGNVPYTLINKRILMLDLASVVAGTKYRGQFEERLKGLISDLQKNKDVILFIDEIHTMIGAGNAEGGLDASNIFKPALARGEIQCIGATTNSEYRKYFESDSALERRFQKVLIEPTTVKQTIEILQKIKTYYEEFHKVKYSDKSIEACVYLTDRYISGRYLPDKAIDILDETGARCHVKNIKFPKELIDISDKINKCEEDKQRFVIEQEYEKANVLKNQIAALQDSYFIEKKKWDDFLTDNPILITEDDVADIVSSITGIAVDKVSEDETEKLLNMADVINGKIIGQEYAVNRLCESVKRARTGIKDPNRPIGSFIFVGPTGVGKTLLAKTVAEYLFGDKNNFIRIDMSEYMEKFNVSRLIGSAPGYVGYEEAGQLTEQVRMHPYSIILFDEIEKAHKDVFNILLQILDEGHLTDSMGRSVDFKNTIIIMTSNVGSRTLQDFGTGIGFSTSVKADDAPKLEKNIIDKDIQKTFSPEFLNRIDDIIFFNTLSSDNLYKIIDIELQSLTARLKNVGYELTISEGVKKYILESDNNLSFGARPIKRIIQQKIANPISDILLNKKQETARHIIIKKVAGKSNELKFILE